jgi:nucleoside-diphosphate-sugar epimerase
MTTENTIPTRNILVTGMSGLIGALVRERLESRERLSALNRIGRANPNRNKVDSGRGLPCACRTYAARV